MSDGRVQTVVGALKPHQLGPTLMHEHLLCDVTPPALAAVGGDEVEIRLDNVWQIRHEWCGHLGNNRLNDTGLMTAELRDFADAGGSAVVDLTTVGIGADRGRLAELSRDSGVHIIAGCGFYTEPFLPRYQRGRSIPDYANAMHGALDPNGSAPAGIIGELGCSDELTSTERWVLAAAGEVQRETGAAVNVHPSRRLDGVLEAIDILVAAGAEPSRIIISHIDRTIFDADSLFLLADTGVVLEYDFFGIESSYYPFDPDVDLPNDAQRVQWLRRLIERGHTEQIAISQDICTRTRLRRLGGHGYGHLLQNVVPFMHRRGIGESAIQTILVETPRRLLTLP